MFIIRHNSMYLLNYFKASVHLSLYYITYLPEKSIRTR